MQAFAGRHDEARENIRAFAANFDDLELNSIWTTALVALAEVCRILDEQEIAASIYERLAPYSARLCVVSLNVSEMGPISRSLGVLATMLGDFAGAERHFDDALATSERIGAPPHVARTQVDYRACCWFGAGRVTRSRRTTEWQTHPRSRSVSGCMVCWPTST